VRPVRWYDLRHSFGTRLVGDGVDVKTVSQLMGHKDVTLTLKHYTHPDADAHRAAVAGCGSVARPFETCVGDRRRILGGIARCRRFVLPISAVRCVNRPGWSQQHQRRAWTGRVVGQSR